MFYDILKILHIISAALLLVSFIYTFNFWLTSFRRNDMTGTNSSLQPMQTQTWALFIPTAIFQLASGFTMVSLKHYDLSEFWIIGSMSGFMMLILSWFGFLYLLFSSPPKNLFYSMLQITLLLTTGITLLFMIFLMTNKIL
jgi:uncharacterized membrane protein